MVKPKPHSSTLPTNMNMAPRQMWRTLQVALWRNSDVTWPCSATCAWSASLWKAIWRGLPTILFDDYVISLSANWKVVCRLPDYVIVELLLLTAPLSSTSVSNQSELLFHFVVVLSDCFKFLLSFSNGEKSSIRLQTFVQDLFATISLWNIVFSNQPANSAVVDIQTLT